MYHPGPPWDENSTRMRGRLVFGFGGVCVLLSASMVPTLCAAQAPALDVMLTRLSAYLLDYETKVFELAADEQYDQWVKRPPKYGGSTLEKRKLKATFFLVKLPDGKAWYGFREVTSVNGKSLKKGARPMAQVLSERTVDALDEALAITRENAKYNIGPVYRNLNVPLQALDLLHPQYRNRFQFTSGGLVREGGRLTFEVDFVESSRPSLVSDGFGGDVPVHGRVLVDPMSGAVLRTEIRTGGNPGSFLRDGFISVEYRLDSRLQMFLPAELEETYGLDSEILHGHASYRNYRRFQTSARMVDAPR